MNEKRLRLRSAGSTLPHLGPTGSSSGWPPSITARYFSSCPSDSTSQWTPCPPGTASGGSRSALAVSSFRLRARLGFSIPSSPPAREALPPRSDMALLIRAPEGLQPSRSTRCSAHTTPRYDSPPPCLRDLSLIAFSLRPVDLSARGGGGVSRFSRTELLCMLWGLRLRGAAPHSRYRAAHCRLPDRPTPSAPRNTRFRSSIPSLQIPLSNASSAALRPPSHGSGPG